MSGTLKPNKKYEHLYAIIRYETDADPATPIDVRVTVKKIMCDPNSAASEVERLNELNSDKGAYYFCQVTRFEGVPVEIQNAASLQSAATESSQG